MKLSMKLPLAIAACALTYSALANVVIKVYSTTDNNFLGTITAENTAKGLQLTPDLKDLSPGYHGFHIHNNPSCSDKGMAAGSHFDPDHTGKHEGPNNMKGHLGDLPRLYVAKDGTATKPVLAPRLTEALILNHSIMIHAHGDSYKDSARHDGGGGMRIACGVISDK